MKFFKLIIIISFFIAISSCGRNGPRKPYPGYPKTYPKINIAISLPKY